MERRAFIGTLTGGILAAPLAAEAQQPGNVARIGFIWSSSPSTVTELVAALRQGLRELGYIEGQNVALEERWAEGRLERLPEFATEMVRSKMDIIMVGSVPAALAAKQATTTIPIVMVAVGEVLETGLVASLAHPGGNITGSTGMYADASAKRLQLLKELLPRLARAAVLWNATNPAKVSDWRRTQAAAQVLGVALQSREVRGPDDFERTFAAMTRARPDALIILGDVLTYSEHRRIVELAAKSRVPTMYDNKIYVGAGGLVSYGADVREGYRRAATYVARILMGTKPSDLPIEQPTKFELVINLKTARALGLTIPQSLLLRADQVIE